MSTRNNYKIESLEPRLMMDAEPLDPALESNLDIEQFDSYVEQIGNLSDAIGGKAVDALGQFNKFDFTQFGLADKANAAVECIFLQFNADPLFAKAKESNSHEAFAAPDSCMFLQ
ncbi:LEPR-XLL domain-containing protein [Fibrobacter sp.]